MRIGPWRAERRHLILFSFFVVTIAALGDAAVFSSTSVPTFESVRAGYRPSDKWILDRNGVPLEAVRTGHSKRSLDWVEWNEVSPAFKKLLIATEDKRFESHIGVDVLALGGAAFGRFSGSKRGASTLSMQVYDLVTGAKTSGRGKLERKVAQIFGALELETVWTKNRILEAYVNLVPFRGELVGLRAASVGLFAKAPLALSSEESAILVALIRSPNAKIEAVTKRACRIEGVDCGSLTRLASEVLTKPYEISRERDVIPVFSNRLVTKGLSDDSNEIATTLDARIQSSVLQSVREQMRMLKEKNVRDAAAVVLDTKTGEILAYVGNAGAGLASRGQVDGVSMRRQAGSTLKPFVYATAFDSGFLDMSSLVEDSPEDIGVGFGSVYSPKNYDHSFAGDVSAAEALASSLNVPAVRTLLLAHETRVLSRLRDLGFTELKDEDHYGPSLALGTVDVSLIELTEAYRRLSLFAKDSIFSDKTKHQIFASLSRPEYRRFTFGLEGLLTLPFPAAVKTGTSKDMRDNWCIGFTSEYTVGVWVGNFDGEPMWNVSGMTGAAPIWRSVMMSLHERPPKDLVYRFVTPTPRLEKATITRIRYPQTDMLVGWDPDIPKRLQQISIALENPQKNHQVFVDGKRLGVAKDILLWPLEKGRHKVELKSKVGRVVDQVNFTVR